ncbi:MAG: hypothetical protein KJ047_13010 [Anaerolineae bacterium]|nr:hypothetical protein [Anaerolineae bacterium]
MADTEQQLRQAAQALRAGRKDEARAILVAVVDEQEHSERAWLYLSAAVDTLEEQQICLENVLTINPTNDKARLGLERVNAALTARQALSAETYTPPFLADDALQPAEDVGWPPGAPYAEEHTDPPQRDPLAPATSVDWGRDDGSAVYGSGRQVDLPSEQEYDDWVAGLNLAAGPTYPTPAPLPAPPPPAAEGNSARSLEESLRSTIAFDDDDLPDDQPVASAPPGDWLAESDELSEMFQRSAQTAAPVFAALEEPEAGATPAEFPTAVDLDVYYEYIPADIEPVESGVDWRGMAYLLAIGILAALNIVSFGYLLR